MKTPFDQLTVPVAERIGDAVERLATAVRAEHWQRAEAAGLTSTQAQILSALSGAAGRPLGVKGLAHLFAVSSATISDSVAALVRKGLVRRVPDPADGRAATLWLTASGEGLLAEWRQAETRVTAAAKGLAAAEQVSLLTLLMKLIRSLQLSGGIPVARMCVTCRYFRPHVHPDLDTPHHCALVDAPFGPQHLRIDCPEHAA